MRGEIARRKGEGYREMREEIKKETTARRKVKVESTIVKGMMWQRLKKRNSEKKGGCKGNKDVVRKARRESEGEKATVGLEYKR